MAKTTLNGRRYWLMMDNTTPVSTALADVTPVNFEVLMCLTSNGFDGTTSPIETTSKCDGGFASSEAGTSSFTMSADGYIVSLTAPDAGVTSNELFKQWRSKEPAWFAIMDTELLGASPVIRYGVGRIDSISEVFPDNEGSTFNISITGIGEPGDQDDIDVTT